MSGSDATPAARPASDRTNSVLAEDVAAIADQLDRLGAEEAVATLCAAADRLDPARPAGDDTAPPAETGWSELEGDHDRAAPADDTAAPDATALSSSPASTADDTAPVIDPTIAQGIRLEDIRNRTPRDLGIGSSDR